MGEVNHDRPVKMPKVGKTKERTISWAVNWVMACYQSFAGDSPASCIGWLAGENENEVVQNGTR